LKFYLTPVRIAIINNKEQQMFAEGRGRRNSFFFLAINFRALFSSTEGHTFAHPSPQTLKFL
jgi:hypothetical protein